MNKLDKKFNPNDYQPKRFGLKYNRPGIILEYLQPSSGKLYHHKIRLYNLKPDGNIQEVMKEIYEKHYLYLDNKKISPNQILQLVERLKMNLKSSENSKGAGMELKPNLNNSSNTKVEINTQINNQIGINNEKNGEKSDDKKMPNVEIDPLEDEEDEDYYKFYDYENEDLNKLNLEELKLRKDEMESLYKKNAVMPGDQNFVFDVRVRDYIIFI